MELAINSPISVHQENGVASSSENVSKININQLSKKHCVIDNPFNDSIEEQEMQGWTSVMKKKKNEVQSSLKKVNSLYNPNIIVDGDEISMPPSFYGVKKNNKFIPTDHSISNMNSHFPTSGKMKEKQSIDLYKYLVFTRDDGGEDSFKLHKHSKGNLKTPTSGSQKSSLHGQTVYYKNGSNKCNTPTKEKIASEILVENERRYSFQIATSKNINQFLHTYCLEGSCIKGNRLLDQVNGIRVFYNSVADKTIHRNKKDSLTVRNANNFVKSVIFSTYIPKDKKILDMGCGRGQDVCKLRYCKPQFVLFVDLSEKSLFQAEKRWRKNKFPFPATFVQSNFCSSNFLNGLHLIVQGENTDRIRGQQRTSTTLNVISTEDGKDLVDVISCQFASHYAFCTGDNAKQFIHNISAVLSPGGIFIGIAPHGETIAEKLTGTSPQSKYDKEKFSLWLDTGVSTSSVDASIEEKSSTAVLPQSCKIVSGTPYWFSMKGTIECKEYIMMFEDLKSLCAAEGMECIYFNNLRTEFRHQLLNPKNNSLLERMNINSDELDPIDSENIGMYCVFVFVKNKLTK